MAAPQKIVHVEVGGSYGGSLRSLETYLSYADHRRFYHELLFYYPTAGAERIGVGVRRCLMLRRSAPRWLLRPRGRKPCNKPALGGHEQKRTVVSEMKPWLYAGLSALPTVLPLLRLLIRGRYSLVHVNNTFTYQAPTILAAFLAGLPVVAEVRSLLPSGTLTRALLRKIDAIVTVAPTLIPDLGESSRGVPIITCFGGVEVEAGRPDGNMRSTILPAGGLLVGSAGRLEPPKGYDVLLRAARRVLDRWAMTGIPVRFVIAGEGPCRQWLQSLIDELGLNGRVHLWGFRSDIANFLSTLDLFVCSSRWEGGPLTVVEAALLEVPVVSTAVGIVPHLHADGGILAVVPPNDPVALGDAIFEALQWRLCAPPGEVAARLQAARRAAATLADPVINAQRLDEIFASVLAHRGSKG